MSCYDVFGYFCPHNPKVAGSNPAPATNPFSTLKALTRERLSYFPKPVSDHSCGPIFPFATRKLNFCTEPQHLLWWQTIRAFPRAWKSQTRSGSKAELLRCNNHVCFVHGTACSRRFSASSVVCLYGATDMGTLRSLDNSITSERLSEQQAADYIAVSLSTLRRWRAEGVGPPFFNSAE